MHLYLPFLNRNTTDKSISLYKKNSRLTWEDMATHPNIHSILEVNLYICKTSKYHEQTVSTCPIIYRCFCRVPWKVYGEEARFISFWDFVKRNTGRQIFKRFGHAYVFLQRTPKCEKANSKRKSKHNLT